jgi:hypothetical protein
MVDYLESTASAGCFPETGNKFLLYVSHASRVEESILLQSKNQNLTIIQILERNGLLSTDNNVFDKIDNMVKANMRASVLISTSNRLELIKFFDKQRVYIESIKSHKDY